MCVSCEKVSEIDMRDTSQSIRWAKVLLLWCDTCAYTAEKPLGFRDGFEAIDAAALLPVIWLHCPS